ncbi:hypothetical protein, partial [Pandoraea sp. NPDC087047]|uniref:hypothetical protein n=1 Tax=Pandoraea sp. NPDC087047 TaxID=3364390 RepID=UPI0037F77AFE
SLFPQRRRIDLGKPNTAPNISLAKMGVTIDFLLRRCFDGGVRRDGITRVGRVLASRRRACSWEYAENFASSPRCYRSLATLSGFALFQGLPGAHASADM